MKPVLICLLAFCCLVVGCQLRVTENTSNNATLEAIDWNLIATDCDTDYLGYLGSGNEIQISHPPMNVTRCLEYCEDGTFDEPNYCYRAIASLTKNISYCPTNDDIFDREECYSHSAVNPEQCELIVKNEEDRGSCYLRLNLPYVKKIFPPNFPSNITARSQELLNDLYGADIVQKHMNLYEAKIMDSGVYCEIMLGNYSQGEGNYYVLSYEVNDFFPNDLIMYIVYDENLQLLCAQNIFNCTAYPQYCPPYRYDSSTDIYSAFSDRCSSLVYAEFYSLGKYYISGWPHKYPLPLNESKPVWVLSFSGNCSKTARHCSPYKDVGVDPHTGEIIYDPSGRCNS